MSEVLEKKEQDYSLNEQMYLNLTKQKTFAKAGLILLIISVTTGIILSFTIGEIEGDIVVVVLIGTIMAYLFLMTWRKKDQRKVLDEYIHQNYFLSFQTLKPEGKNSLEKFLSIAQNVFPTIKKTLKEYSNEKLDWVNTYDKLDGKYKFDISLKTDDGLFLLKYFSDRVKFEDVEKLVAIARKYYRSKEVLRFVCLSKKFDDIFFSDELNNKMEQLNPSKPIEYKTFLSRGRSEKWIKLDLILERENGYTMIWIDE